MKFTDIKNKVKDLWEYDGEFIWTSNEFKWSRVSSRNSNLKTKNSYFLEFYNDSNDNFFRISDSDGNIVQGRKVVEIRQGDKVEIIALNNLDLNYYFGKVFYIGNDFVQLDISSSCESGAVFIKLKDIRDVEVCNDGEFKLRPILAEPPEEER